MRTFWYVTLFVLAFSARQAVAEPLYWQAKTDDLTLTILGS
ncbi:TraB/GumN family protein, partial [Vibrio sp. 10N.261.48.A2]